MSDKPKNKLLFFSVVFAGILFAGILGTILGNIPGLDFFNMGIQIGSPKPLVINLMIIEFTVGLLIKLNIMSVIGGVLGYVIARKII